MNRKRFYRNRYRSRPFPTLLTTTTTTIVAAVIALVVLSPTVYSRVYSPPYKLSSCATVVPRQTAAVSQHFRSTNPHIIAATDSEYSQFTTTMHNQRRRYVARLIGETVTVGQAANNTSNHTRCYKIKFTTAVPTTKRWSPILKTYPNFPAMNTTVTKVTTAKITKITKASTTTEATSTETPEETQETEETTTTEETSSKEETACTEETASTEETSSSEETTCSEEETTLIEVTTPKKNTKKITTESTVTEKASKTTVMSTEKTSKMSKTTGKSSRTTEKLSKPTKKMTKPTEAADDVVTCSEDPSCDEEPSCLDDEVTTSKPTKTKPPLAKKTTRIIKPKNRSMGRRLDRRRQPPTTMHRQSPSSSATIALDDSLWSDDGLHYESP